MLLLAGHKTDKKRIEFVRPYLQLSSSDLVDQPASHRRITGLMPTPPRQSRRSGDVDRLRTTLLIAAAFASVLVAVVAAKSLFMNNTAQGSAVQAQR